MVLSFQLGLSHNSAEVTLEFLRTLFCINYVVFFVPDTANMVFISTNKKSTFCNLKLVSD